MASCLQIKRCCDFGGQGRLVVRFGTFGVSVDRLRPFFMVLVYRRGLLILRATTVVFRTPIEQILRRRREVGRRQGEGQRAFLQNLSPFFIIPSASANLIRTAESAISVSGNAY